MALSARVVWVALGWSERAPPPAISVFQGIDFFSAGDPLDTVFAQQSYDRNGMQV
jgi:hypothetical protein